MLKNTPTAVWHYLNSVDLVCFSHLRWNFVFQRPQHLLSRFSKHTRVFFIEEPIFHDAPEKLHIDKSEDNVHVVVPHLQHGLSEEQVIARQKALIQDLISLMESTVTLPGTTHRWRFRLRITLHRISCIRLHG
jgi:UDP-galactopyranose mutase